MRAARRPFELFDFAPMGGIADARAGTAFFALIARRWLPQRDPGRESTSEAGPTWTGDYALQETTVEVRVLRVRPRSSVRRWSRVGFGFATGLNVFAVYPWRGGFHRRREATIILQADDRLEVEGHLDRLEELRGLARAGDRTIGPGSRESRSLTVSSWPSLQVAPNCDLIGKDLRQTDFRNRFGVIVLALRREGRRACSPASPRSPLRRGRQVACTQGHRLRIEALRDCARNSRLVFPEPTRSLAREQYQLEEKPVRGASPGGVGADRQEPQGKPAGRCAGVGGGWASSATDGAWLLA